MTTTLALVRHGQTAWNLDRRIQGSSDIPLNDTGRKQAESTGRFLAGREWQGIYASTLGRARETAQIIAGIVGLPSPTTLQGIEERAYGEMEGLNAEEIMARFPDGAHVPGRETPENVVERAYSALLGLAEENEGRSLVIVSHGGVIGSLVRFLTNNELPIPGEPILNGSVTDFVYHGDELHLDKLNQTPEGDELFANALA